MKKILVESRRDRCAFARFGASVLVFLLGGAVAASAALSVPGVGSETTLPVPLPAHAYGMALSSDGQRALVGATDEAAYVFVRSGDAWVQEARLTASDAASGSGFGHSPTGVALSADGSRALVGAELAPTSTPCPVLRCGAVYVFVRSGSVWAEEAKLQFGDPGPNSPLGVSFGGTVALSGDGATALGSAPFVECTGGAGENCGAVAVFRRSGSSWALEQQIRPADAATLDGFGLRAALSGDGNTALIGASNQSCASGSGCGAAYVFTRSGAVWSQSAKLTNPDGGTDNFGASVSLTEDGGLAAVSSLGVFPSFNGAVYLFARSGGGWAFSQRLRPAEVTAGDRFGESATLSGDGQSLLASSLGDSCASGASCGKLYLFTRSSAGFTERLGFRASDTAASHALGHSTALSGDGATALAQATPCGGTECGVVYAFTFAELAVVATPTLSEIGLAALAVLLAAAGALALKKRAA